jgi:hypothetical protein
MSASAEKVIRGVAIPRLDAAGHGVHLAWSGPDLVPLALDGYEVRRRKARPGERRRVCVELDRERLELIAERGFLPDELGTIRCRPARWPQLHVGEEIPPSQVQKLLDSPAPSPAFAATTTTGAMTSPQLFVFTQELRQPSNRVFVTCLSRGAFAIAISAGKALTLKGLPPGVTVTLDGQEIDSVAVYTIAPSELEICAEVPDDEKRSEREWAQAQVLARELTLPLAEVDPSLADRDDELAAARSRLLASESLDDAEAGKLAAALRAAAGRSDLGRPCDRVMLSRAETGEPFQETLFTSRITLLSLDPRWRRVLGFGFADTTAQEGETYEYRVSGHFPGADLDDEIYDVHTVPSGTPLPMAVHVRDLSLHFPAPTTVVLDPPPDPDALEDVSRRAIALRPPDDPFGFLGGDLLADLCCLIQLPRPCEKVVLELAEGHDLQYAGAQDGDPFSPPLTPLPPGPSASLSFPAPVAQIRLTGRGSLFAVRIPGDSGKRRLLARELGPVEFAPQPLPREPPALVAVNLQTPPAVLTGPLGEQTKVPPRPQPGFKLTWVPCTTSPTGLWPEDLAAGPPLEAIAHQIEHRRVYPTSGGADTWEPIHAGDNLTFASWPASGGRPSLSYGADLDEVFPIRESREAGAPLTMSLTDVFGVRDPETGEQRPPAPLGSYHEYRIRAVDVVGRVGAGWTSSNQARLEKHVPPPLPVGPQPPPLPTDGRLSGPVGVRARPILASDPGLSAADRALLAGHDSAVLIEWGWRPEERELDPTTAEFRVYLQRRPPTEVPGTIEGVASGAGTWTVDFSTDRVLAADECRDQWIKAGDTTFRILGHGAGSSVQLTLAANATAPAMAPPAGPASFGRPLAPQHQRPASWESRVEVVALSGANTYRHAIHDALAVNATNRRETVWVGVSAADAEPYVSDELPTASPHGGRPGNESSIASVSATATYRGRPSFSLPPPLGEVPELVSDEPSGRQVNVALDGPSLLAGALPSSTEVALDRCPADAILAITRVDGAGTVTMRRADGSLQTVAFPNPDDEAAVRAALGSNHPERIPSRYLLFLLGHFDRPDELLKRAGGQLMRLDALADAVDPRPGRYFYRVRRADTAGAVSTGGAILPIVARVPSTSPPPAPRRVEVATKAGLALTLTVEVDPDPDLRWVLVFSQVAPWSDSPPDPARARLLRMPNRRDLYPVNGIRLRLPGGELVAPVAKAIADPDVVEQEDGTLLLTVSSPLTASGDGPEAVQYWCYALSRDGIPSRPLGPASIGLGGTA